MDYKASHARNISELEEMCRIQVILGDIPSSIYYEVSQLISDFKWSEHTTDTFFADYFSSHHLTILPSYDEQVHRNLGYYPIFKIIYWVRYPSRFSFKEIYDRLSSGSSYSSNLSIVAVNPRDYLDKKGKRLSIWTYPSLKDKSFCITGKIEVIDPSTQRPYTQKAFSSLIRANGGKIEEQITSDLDYLIVGGSHSPSYTGTYKGLIFAKANFRILSRLLNEYPLKTSLNVGYTKKNICFGIYS